MVFQKSSPKNAALEVSPVTDFMTKVKLAWRIFFPPQGPTASPKDEVKKRLRMILVADRCGMSPLQMSEMKRSIVHALEDYVDVDNEETVEVSVSTEPDLGTIYCVAVPVKRVRPDQRTDDYDVEMGPIDSSGVRMEWEADWDTNPASRFPMGC